MIRLCKMAGAETLHFKDPSEYTPGEILIRREKIQERIREMAPQIVTDYQGKELLIVGLLKGGIVTTVHLGTALYNAGLTDVDATFMTVKSYTDATTAAHKPMIVQDIPDIDVTNKHILLVDDICDTGWSLDFVSKHMTAKGAASVASFVLLDKPSRREVEYVPTYVAFPIPNIWVQGLGMDTRGRGRFAPDVLVGPFTPPRK